MKKQEKYKTTSNRYVYNRLRKQRLASCSFCKWHGNFYRMSENDDWETYWLNGKKPSWKLVSKNKKQWMKKPLKIKTNPNAWKEKYRHKITW